ncbi:MULTISPECIES: hypothetical protein [Pseudomonas]|uniref:hypothetical protein n=1 Tax=Pseudomonas TaxID=286 RepID=UPI00110C90F5|nr:MULTISPECIES: hypothetical protein [Pseudomonas]MBW4794415.1 hypothetical protein [Pseudomonas tolaasii]
MSKPIRPITDYVNTVADPALDKYATYRLVGCTNISAIVYDLKKVIKIRLGGVAYKFHYFWLNTSIGTVVAFSGDKQVMEVMANRLLDRSLHFTRAECLHAGGGAIRFKAYMQTIEMMYRPVPGKRSYSGSAVNAHAIAPRRKKRA